jgi:hypothetical protein
MIVTDGLGVLWEREGREWRDQMRCPWHMISFLPSRLSASGRRAQYVRRTFSFVIRVLYCKLSLKISACLFIHLLHPPGCCAFRTGERLSTAGRELKVSDSELLLRTMHLLHRLSCLWTKHCT